MPILGHGIDIVEVARIRRLHRDHGQRFLDRCFTAEEQAYCARSAKRQHEHLAGRFAAKEAVLKALGTGLSHGIRWTDLHITRSPAGGPTLTLIRTAQQVAAARGIRSWTLSISHIESHATASAIAEG